MPHGFPRTPASPCLAKALLALFGAVWIALAISPWYRQDWALENVLVVVAVTPACIELLDRVAPPRGIWRYLLPVSFIMSQSLLFELFEWAAASVFGGDLGQAYLGTQGDVWDAQKDMLLATLGSALAVAVLGLRGWLSPRR